jgi:hypothetical protein
VDVALGSPEHGGRARPFAYPQRARRRWPRGFAGQPDGNTKRMDILTLLLIVLVVLLLVGFIGRPRFYRNRGRRRVVREYETDL